MNGPAFKESLFVYLWIEDNIWKFNNNKILKIKSREWWKGYHQVLENCQMSGKVICEGWEGLWTLKQNRNNDYHSR